MTEFEKMKNGQLFNVKDDRNLRQQQVEAQSQFFHLHTSATKGMMQATKSVNPAAIIMLQLA